MTHNTYKYPPRGRGEMVAGAPGHWEAGHLLHSTLNQYRIHCPSLSAGIIESHSEMTKVAQPYALTT